jgi:hypothetical protein
MGQSRTLDLDGIGFLQQKSEFHFDLNFTPVTSVNRPGSLGPTRGPEKGIPTPVK